MIPLHTLLQDAVLCAVNAEDSSCLIFLRRGGGRRLTAVTSQLEVVRGRECEPAVTLCQSVSSRQAAVEENPDSGAWCVCI